MSWEKEGTRYPSVSLWEEWEKGSKQMVEGPSRPVGLESRNERSEWRLSSITLKINGHIPHLCGLINQKENIDHQGWRYVSTQILHKYETK